MIDFHTVIPQKYWAPPASWTDEKKKEITRSRIFSGDWAGAQKMDGAFYKFWKDENGKMELLSRSKGVSGDYAEKIGWVPQLNKFFNGLPNGTCLLGELYFPEKQGSRFVTTIMGCLKEKAIARQESGDKLHYYVFDVLAYDGESLLDQPFSKRISKLQMVEGFYQDFECVEFAQYFRNQDLWDRLQYILANGGEGIVMTRLESKYQPDKRPSKDCQKVKKELKESIDCFFTGRAKQPTQEYTGKELMTWQYWQNTLSGEKMVGTFYKDYMDGVAIIPITKPFYMGLAGSLEIGVVKGGKVVPIGYLSGLTEEMKADPAALKGKCIEVTAMQIDETGGLRHAKMVGFRTDLTPKDCTWEKIFG